MAELRAIPFEEAERIVSRLPVPAPRSVPLAEALGRVVAEDVYAPIALPPFDRAAVDGFAVVASDTFGAGEEHAKKLRIAAEYHPSDVPARRIRTGMCAYVATGAMLPNGADAVVMIEHALEQRSAAQITRAAAPGENVSEKGSDVEKGARVLKKGTAIAQRHNAMLAALGIRSVLVHMPVVSIISFGDELAQPGGMLGAGRIFDANSRMLADGAARCGCAASFAGIVRDDVGRISKALEKAASADVVLCSGGTSAGRGDLLADALKRLRAKMLFHGVAAKPGKPTLLAMLGAKPVFGLPGYPISCYMLFDSLVAPYLRKCSRTAQQHQSTSARLASAYNNATGRLVFQPVKLERSIAYPVYKDSGAIATLAEADGYFAVPASVKRIEKGEAVAVVLL